MLGTYPGEEDARDAFHVACVAVTCETDVKPGESLRFTHYKNREVETCVPGKRQGIVDPMLVNPVPAGQVFWLCLNPGSTKKLTHSFEIEGEPEAWEDEDDRIACREMGCG